MKPQTIQIFLSEGAPTSVKEVELTNHQVKKDFTQKSIIIMLIGILMTCNASAKQESNIADESDWFVPDGVVFVSGDVEQVEVVKNKLERAFSEPKKGLYKLAKKQSGYFFLGPLISARLREENPTKVSELRTAGYRVKIMEDFEPKIQGLLAKTNQEKKLLSQLLSDRIGDSKKLILRKLHPDELAFMWYFVSWDIKEPVFVLETDDHTFLVDFGAISENQLWIEEMSNPCYQFGFEEIISPCVCFGVQMQGKKWLGGFIEKPHQCTMDVVQTSLTAQQGADENQNLPVSLEAVLFIDDEYVIGANLATDVMANWIKKLEHELNIDVLSGQQGKVAIKVTVLVTGHPEFEIEYHNEIDEAWLLKVENKLSTIIPINAKSQSVSFELIFAVETGISNKASSD